MRTCSFTNFPNCLGKWVLARQDPERWFFIRHHLCYVEALFPLLFYFKSIPLPWLIEPFWNVPGRKTRLFSQLGNNNVFTFSWPFSKWGPFIYVSLSIEINWLTSWNCVSPQTFRNKKLLFWCVKGTDCPRFLYPPRTQGWKECFIITCYWILKNDSVSFLPLCLCFSLEHFQTPYPWHLVITEPPLGPLSNAFWFFSHIFSSLSFALWTFLYLAFHFHSVHMHMHLFYLSYS